jgi:hypothetical protein
MKSLGWFGFRFFGDRDMSSHWPRFFEGGKSGVLKQLDGLAGTSRSIGDGGGDWRPQSYERTDIACRGRGVTKRSNRVAD